MAKIEEIKAEQSGQVKLGGGGAKAPSTHEDPLECPTGDASGWADAPGASDPAWKPPKHPSARRPAQGQSPPESWRGGEANNSGVSFHPGRSKGKPHAQPGYREEQSRRDDEVLAGLDAADFGAALPGMQDVLGTELGAGGSRKK